MMVLKVLVVTEGLQVCPFCKLPLILHNLQPQRTLPKKEKIASEEENALLVSGVRGQTGWRPLEFNSMSSSQAVQMRTRLVAGFPMKSCASVI